MQHQHPSYIINHVMHDMYIYIYYNTTCNISFLLLQLWASHLNLDSQENPPWLSQCHNQREPQQGSKGHIRNPSCSCLPHCRSAGSQHWPYQQFFFLCPAPHIIKTIVFSIQHRPWRSIGLHPMSIHIPTQYLQMSVQDLLGWKQSQVLKVQWRKV